MADSRPLGLFDSGVGGLSIWQEVVRCLPDEATLYFADSAHCPYGPRPAAEIKTLSAAIVRFLLRQECKLIVVACNTASAAALASLRAEFEVPIVGLEPAVKPAIAATRTGRVGVLATAGTVQGYLFQNTAQRYAQGIEVHVQVGDGLVEQIEAGRFDTPETEALLRHYLEPMLAAQVDQIALGCTHYPLLMPLIRRIVAGRAGVIDPAQAVARQVQRILQHQNLGNIPHALAQPQHFKGIQHKFYTTGQPHLLQALASALSQRPVTVRQVASNQWLSTG